MLSCSCFTNRKQEMWIYLIYLNQAVVPPFMNVWNSWCAIVVLEPFKTHQSTLVHEGRGEAVFSGQHSSWRKQNLGGQRHSMIDCGRRTLPSVIFDRLVILMHPWPLYHVWQVDIFQISLIKWLHKDRFFQAEMSLRCEWVRCNSQERCNNQ